MTQPNFAAVLLTVLVLATLPRLARAAPLREKLCRQSGYTCVTVQPGDTWEKLWPEARARDLVQRVNRMNIRLRTGMVLAVPEQLETQTLLQLSPLPQHRDAAGGEHIFVQQSQLAWGAYDTSGALIAWGPMAGGKGWCPDVGAACRTPNGDFAVRSKQGARCKSSKFPLGKGGAPMPYCMFFRGGYALHGSADVPGYPASHGCVRLFPEDARWLNEDFVEVPQADNGYHGTRVTIAP